MTEYSHGHVLSWSSRQNAPGVCHPVFVFPPAAITTAPFDFLRTAPSLSVPVRLLSSSCQPFKTNTTPITAASLSTTTSVSDQMHMGQWARKSVYVKWIPPHVRHCRTPPHLSALRGGATHRHTPYPHSPKQRRAHTHTQAKKQRDGVTPGHAHGTRNGGGRRRERRNA